LTLLDGAAVMGEALANAEAAVAIFDTKRRFHAVNDRYVELTGYSREEIETHRAGQSLRLEPVEDEEEFITLITSEISAGEADIILKNGEPLAVEYVVTPTRVGDEPHFIEMMWPLVPRVGSA
jgi:PAS domain S-box-containing protein